MEQVEIVKFYKKMEEEGKMFKTSAVNIQEAYDFLKELLEEECIKGQLVENYKSLSNNPKNNSIAILFYNGYLTYKDSDKFTSTFVVPNRIIRVYFAEYFSTLVKRNQSKEEK